MSKTQADIEAEQEAMLKAKYGGLKPKQRLLPKDHKFFDSADWAMQKQNPGARGAPKPSPQAPKADAPSDEAALEPKTEPTGHKKSNRSSLDRTSGGGDA
ncbi:unnamed protein product [Pedinophyceae sp. YPF-701]|nr:unnamed protein product [Pedinophyceae sp. YPF-701]